jgi:hypothetical protein
MIRSMLAFGLVVLSVSTATAAEPLPAGSYAGSARWSGPNGKGGSYTVERSIKGNVVTSHYQWTGTKRANETHRVTFVIKDGSPFFEVTDEKNQVVGKGFCFENVCSYTVNESAVHVVETMRFGDGVIEVSGSKTGPGFAVVWKEDLRRK